MAVNHFTSVRITARPRNKITIQCVSSDWLEYLTVTQVVAGSNPVRTAKHGVVAPMVERKPEELRVGGSNPPHTTFKTKYGIVAQLV